MPLDKDIEKLLDDNGVTADPPYSSLLNSEKNLMKTLRKRISLNQLQLKILRSIIFRGHRVR